MKKDTLVTLYILLIVGIFIIISFQYSNKARLLPLLVGLPLLCLSIFQLTLDTIPALSELKTNIENKNLLKNQENVPKNIAKQKKEEEFETNKKENKARKEILLWLLCFMILIWITGFIVSIALFLFFYFNYYKIYKWHTNILVSIATSAIVYFIFVNLLNINLYKGLIFYYISINF